MPAALLIKATTRSVYSLDAKHCGVIKMTLDVTNRCLSPGSWSRLLDESARSARISGSEISNTFTWTDGQFAFDAGMTPATNPSVFQHALAVP